MGCILSQTIEAEYFHAVRIDSPHKDELREEYHRKLEEEAFDEYIKEFNETGTMTLAAEYMKDYYLQLQRGHNEKF
jgi:hypothetical protein